MNDKKVICVQNRSGNWRVWTGSVGGSREIPSQLDTPVWETKEEALAFADGWQLNRGDIECIEVLPSYIGSQITQMQVWQLLTRAMLAGRVRSLEFAKHPFCITLWLWDKMASPSFGSFQSCMEWMDSHPDKVNDGVDRS